MNWQVAEVWFVTPAKAGVQELKSAPLFNILDSGFRRNDEF
jgi:hypothetical protein